MRRTYPKPEGAFRFVDVVRYVLDPQDQNGMIVPLFLEDRHLDTTSPFLTSPYRQGKRLAIVYWRTTCTDHRKATGINMGGIARGSANGPKKIFGRENVNWQGPKAASAGRVSGDKSAAVSDFAPASQEQNLAPSPEDSLELIKDAADRYDNGGNHSDQRKAFTNILSDRLLKGDMKMDFKIKDAIHEGANPVVAMESYPYEVEEDVEDNGIIFRTYVGHPLDKRETISVEEDGVFSIASYTVGGSIVDVNDRYKDGELARSSIGVDSDSDGVRIHVRQANEDDIENGENKFTTTMGYNSSPFNTELSEVEGFINTMQEKVKEAKAIEFLANSLR